MQSGAIMTGEGKTAIVETKEVDLNKFLELYNQQNFSKILLKD